VPDFPQPPEINDNMLILQLRAQWTLQDQGRGESSWSFAMLNAGVETQKGLLWDLWHDIVKVHWMARRPSSWHFDRVLIEDRFPGTTIPLEILIDEYGPGPSSNSAPVQTGPVVSWRTQYPGRSYRGRTYWGPIMADDLADAFITTELIDEIDAWIDSMFSAFYVGVRSETEPHFVIVSRRHDNMPEPVGRWANVTDVRQPRYIGTQRRRLHFFT
jgi:hypothetical protein